MPDLLKTTALFILSSTFRWGDSVRVENSEIAKILHRPIRALSFPENSGMGIFFALAVPLEEPLNQVSLSYFFEATYQLPPNSTDFGPWLNPDEYRRKKRSLDRTTTYGIIENKFESFGYPGRECLLRSICEASQHPLEHNGVLGDILRVIFAPSTSRPEDLPEEVLKAEHHGKDGSCEGYEKICPLGLLDLVGTLL
ncbi:uncharacterized protein LOC105701923 [Orussus abietinus]|uniref:uncharacterized protein LOC105701923 n=1 Tax=Orussus abietinus TaxID=222816 RepID=UPI000626A34D|nr:uncharacterized protein LOC105701923 [Orussus abietinus]